MREIKFRGLDKRGNWHYGFFWKNTTGDCFIREKIAKSHTADFEVIPKTVGEFTGLCDKNGKEIFEGDIVKVPDHHQDEILWEEYVGKIYYSDGCWLIEMSDSSLCEDINEDELYLKRDKRNLKVIGNIYENPELLSEEEK